MKTIYKDILEAIERKQKLLAILIDPDKMKLENARSLASKIKASVATHIFVGGSSVEANQTQKLVLELENTIDLPIIIFPGDVNQITEKADALLFLSLLSGRNPDYLIGKHIEAVPKLRNSELEVIPTGYILIENGKETSVQKVTETEPLPTNNIQKIVDTAKAGEYLGMKLMYLECGSGATHPVPDEIINAVKNELKIPLIVGGGIRSLQQMETAYHSGADMVVIGTAIEENDNFLKKFGREMSVENIEKRVENKEKGIENKEIRIENKEKRIERNVRT